MLCVTPQHDVDAVGDGCYCCGGTVRDVKCEDVTLSILRRKVRRLSYRNLDMDVGYKMFRLLLLRCWRYKCVLVIV